MSWPTLRLTLRLRLVVALSAGVGLIAVLLVVGALFPAVGHTIGKLDIPASVANLLGGGDYGTITGWFRSEIASIYGPLVIGAVAITAGSAAIAGDEEDGVSSLVLAYPLRRSDLIVAKTGAVGVLVVVLGLSTWIGLVAGVALGGGGIGLADITALSVQLTFFGFATGALAVAVAAGTGRRALATGIASGVAILGWLINSFAPLVGGIGWLKYLSPFYYYAAHDPLTNGVWVTGLIVLGAATAVLIVSAVAGIERRDLR